MGPFFLSFLFFFWEGGEEILLVHHQSPCRPSFMREIKLEARGCVDVCECLFVPLFLAFDICNGLSLLSRVKEQMLQP